MTVEHGDVVEVDYVGRITKTGEIFDLTSEELAGEEVEDAADLTPAQLLIGEHYVLPSLEHHVEEMDVGDEDTVEISAEDAFGERDSDNIRTISRKEFEKYDVDPRRGMPVEVDGQRGKILTASSGRVKVDFNHPLAGKDLTYTVTLLREIEDPAEQVMAVLDYHSAEDAEVDVEDGEATATIGQDLPDEVIEHLEDELEKINGITSASITTEAADDGAD